MVNVEVMILDYDKPCVILGKYASRRISEKLIKQPEDGFKLRRWDQHLSEETRKRIQAKREKISQSAEDPKETSARSEINSENRVIKSNSMESAGNAENSARDNKACVGKLNEVRETGIPDENPLKNPKPSEGIQKNVARKSTRNYNALNISKLRIK